MGFIWNVLKSIIKFILYVTIFFTIIVMIPNLPPYKSFTKIELEPTLSRSGPLAHNDILNNPQKLFKGKLLGPEAFQVFDDELYTSLGTGEIVKISPGGHITFVTKIGEPCAGVTKEHICGRPLGFDIDSKNRLLYVSDPYYGIWKVDLKTDKKKLLVSPRVEIEGRTPKILNSLAIDDKGDLYWTASCSDFYLYDGSYSSLTDPSGRLLHYNSAKNISKVLIDNLWFPNGVVISEDKQFVVVSETFRYRLLKHYINGPNKGKTEVLIAGLPGAPDNLRKLPDGSGLLVGLYVVFDDEYPLITRSLAQTPLLRKFIARMFRLIEIPFEFINSHYQMALFEDIVHHIGHFKSVSGLAPGLSGVLQIDWNGNIIAAYYNTDREVRHISDAIVYKDNLYLGSPNHQDFIAAVPAPPLLKNAFLKKSESNVAKEIPAAEFKPNVQEQVKLEGKKNNIKGTLDSTQSEQNIPSKREESKPVKVSKNVKETSPKQTETNPTSSSKQPQVKQTQHETKPTSSSKQPEVKQSQHETKPTSSSKQPEVKQTQHETKPTSSSKQPEVKQTQHETKPTKSSAEDHVRQSEIKEKISKQAEVKQTQQSKPTAKNQNEAGINKAQQTKPIEIPQKQKESEQVKSPKSAENHQEQVKTKQPEKKEQVPNVVEIKSKPQKDVDKKQTESTKNGKNEQKSASKLSDNKETLPSKQDSKPTLDASKQKIPEPGISKSQTVPSSKQSNIKPESQKLNSKPKDAEAGSKNTNPTNKQSPPDQIPIKEHIPSDTAIPPRETLKVIKKGGPTEIPNPQI